MDKSLYFPLFTFLVWSLSAFYVIADYTPIKLAYKVFEPAGGADESLSPIIFVHGITASKEIWRDIPQDVADETKRMVYAYDIRNHGETEYTDASDFDQSIEDVFQFMDSINTSRAILIGHSLGGHAVIQAALRKPEMVELLVVEDMHTKPFSKTQSRFLILFLKSFEKIVHAFPKDLTPLEAVERLIDMTPKNNPFFRKTDNLIHSMVLKRQPDGGYDVNFYTKGLIKALENIEKGMSDASGQYTGPSYFIIASESPLQVYKEEDNIKKHFPNSEIIYFDNATHNAHVGYPEKFTELIINIVQKHKY